MELELFPGRQELGRKSHEDRGNLNIQQQFQRRKDSSVLPSSTDFCGTVEDASNDGGSIFARGEGTSSRDEAV